MIFPIITRGHNFEISPVPGPGTLYKTKIKVYGAAPMKKRLTLVSQPLFQIVITALFGGSTILYMVF